MPISHQEIDTPKRPISYPIYNRHVIIQYAVENSDKKVEVAGKHTIHYTVYLLPQAGNQEQNH